eukprot:COSAG02_NODE_33_length_50286_cov_83.550760_25_plen_63_part_00
MLSQGSTPSSTHRGVKTVDVLHNGVLETISIQDYMDQHYHRDDYELFSEPAHGGNKAWQRKP